MTQLAAALSSLALPGERLCALEQFCALFGKWNERINLSAASNAAEISEHVRDSLHVVPHLPTSGTVVDVGSGGGLPVVVAAICLPGVQFTALEPVHKKHAFLRTAARELGLPNLESFARRMEDHDADDHDAAMSRATFDIREWVFRGRELVKVGGLVIAFEAIPRDDIPVPFERHAYQFAGKQRAIIIARRDA
ncbi:MAG TPA: 16S rRNA (guanine(527)-N(7))-methyltransferase RsmG [Kofleriaceae bacterium]|nr:16S rRNA (guanine(527)-N(7))-methyltransferase RsmG [Kofleriaceae bacterium]